MKKISLWLKTIAALALLLACQLPVFSVTRTVTNCADNSGAGSLRQAISEAAADDLIVFNIPTTEAGYTTKAWGSYWQINITSEALPAIINNGVIVSGESQTTNQGDK